MGRIPNMMRTLAHSPAALEMYLAMSGALKGSTLSLKDQERLALSIARQNDCAYCDRAHTAIGKGAGLSEGEIAAAREGGAAEAKSQAILAFASAIVAREGKVTDAELAAAREILTETEILDVLACASLNIYTNYINHVCEPEIDF